MTKAGEMAPEFELTADDGRTIRLRDLRGRRVVLFFYPKDDTSGCTKEACGFRDSLEAFTSRDTVILGVSPDDEASHARFRDKHRLNFPLLVDAGHRVAEAYGAWGLKKRYGREYEGILRTTFVIGPDGRVERVYERVRPDGHAEELLEALPVG
ncbi:MAG: thioredoxin-dependent thiol peroxidase [Gemmatimonadota bacterium]